MLQCLFSAGWWKSGREVSMLFELLGQLLPSVCFGQPTLLLSCRLLSPTLPPGQKRFCKGKMLWQLWRCLQNLDPLFAMMQSQLECLLLCMLYVLDNNSMVLGTFISATRDKFHPIMLVYFFVLFLPFVIGREKS